MASGLNPNLMSTMKSNFDRNEINRESQNRNLTIKEIYSIFGPCMITHKLIELDEDFKKYLMLDGISLAPEEKKLISRDISDKILSEIKTHDYVFIKFNSKAPTDSEFLCIQLKCFSLDDILSLLKGSEKLYLQIDFLAKALFLSLEAEIKVSDTIKIMKLGKLS